MREGLVDKARAAARGDSSGEHGRHNRESGQDREQQSRQNRSYTRSHKVLILMDIRGICHHDSHTEGHRIEALSESECEGPSGKFGEIRLDQVFYSLFSPRHIHRINHYQHNEDEKEGNGYLIELLYTVLDSERDDACGTGEENRVEDERNPSRGTELAEIQCERLEEIFN